MMAEMLEELIFNERHCFCFLSDESSGNSSHHEELCSSGLEMSRSLLHICEIGLDMSLTTTKRFSYE